MKVSRHWVLFATPSDGAFETFGDAHASPSESAEPLCFHLVNPQEIRNE
jgi:hypothetical protein